VSTDWNVHCVDCNATHQFNDANHQDELMALLCKHADAIAGLAALTGAAGPTNVELRTYYGAIDVGWFVEHRGHRLVPVSEYGDLLTQCIEYVRCTCGSMRRCTRDVGHDGDHNTEGPDRR
jgi:hypothetical protein